MFRVVGRSDCVVLKEGGVKANSNDVESLCNRRDREVGMA